MLNFEFLEKGLGIVSLQNFVNDISRKMLLMLYSIYNQISLLQKMKFSITDFFSKYDKIHSFLRIWSHLRKKSLMENFIFCAVCAFCFEILQISQKNACVEVSFLKQLQVVRKALLMRNTTLKVP